MTENITARRAISLDVDDIARFNRAMAQETENKELIESTAVSGVASLLETPELGFYVVAESAGMVVGSLMVTMEWSDWRNGVFWWIQSVYVLPSHRRKGVYRKLYEFVKACASRDSNVCGFRLYVEKNNLPAQKTYEALGMEEANYKMYEAPIDS